MEPWNYFEQLINRNVMVLLAYVVLAVPAFAYAAQGDARMQLKTAEQHATFATKADNSTQTHLHLHHVINCLVGPNGEGFDAKAGNPCQGQGNGVLNDMTGTTQEKDSLKQALSLAKIGVTIQDHQPVYYTAMAVKALLEAAAQDK